MKAMVRVTFELDTEHTADSYEQLQFLVEEHTCVQNYILEMARLIEATPGICSVCCDGSAELIQPTEIDTGQPKRKL
jgi:hypothetical protein